MGRIYGIAFALFLGVLYSGDVNADTVESESGANGASSECIEDCLTISIRKTDDVSGLIELYNGNELVDSYDISHGGALTPEGEYRVTDVNRRTAGWYQSIILTSEDGVEVAMHGLYQGTSSSMPRKGERTAGCVMLEEVDNVIRFLDQYFGGLDEQGDHHYTLPRPNAVRVEISR